MSKSNLKVAFQMDEMEGINIDGDSTFVLMLEAQQRGFELWHYLASDLSYEEGVVFAAARKVEVRREKGNHFSFLSEPQKLDLREVDVVWMRQDPPFDMSYITATHLLDLIADDTLVMNNPAEVRNAPEKLLS